MESHIHRSLVSLFCHGLGPLVLLSCLALSQKERERSLLFRNEHFSSACENFLFAAFVWRFLKLAVILGFNVCVLRRFLGLEGAIRTVLLPVLNFLRCLTCITESNCEV